MSPAPTSRIDSASNSRFRQWRRWVDDPGDPECPYLPLEGGKQVEELASHRHVQLLVGSPPGLEMARLARKRARQVVEIPERLMKSLSGVRSPQGVVAFVEKPQWKWEDLTPWVLYLDGVQDPGNLGTTFRTARAAGGFSLATSPGTVSCFNAKVVRASAGYLFEVPFLEAVEAEALAERGYLICSTDPEAETSLFSEEFRPPTAFALGSEGSGVSPRTAKVVRHSVRIPMDSGPDSLNVSISAALVMYEIRRRSSRP